MVISKRNMQKQKVREAQEKCEQLHLDHFIGLKSEQEKCFESGVACSYGICSECKQQINLSIKFVMEGIKNDNK